MTFMQAGNNSFNKREKAAEDMYVKEQEKEQMKRFKESVMILVYAELMICSQAQLAKQQADLDQQKKQLEEMEKKSS
jgi:hypothetical protein